MSQFNVSNLADVTGQNARTARSVLTAASLNTSFGNIQTAITDLNDAAQALATSQSGASAPGHTLAGTFWFDSTNLLMQWYEVSAGTLRVAVSRDKAETLSSKTLSSPTITGVAAFPDGTAALPSITNTGDLDTGFFFPAANAVGIAALGVEPLRVTVTTDLTDAVVAILSTEESTSPTTGALTVGDGLGVAGALWVGGLANIAGVTTLAGGLAKDTSVATNSTETLLIGGVIHLDPATATRAGATGVLSTYTLPAATLAVDKQAVRITAWGTKSGSAASAVIQLRFNAGAQASYTIAAGETAWRVIWYIVRTGAATQDFSASYSGNAAIATDSGTDAETLANALAIDINVSAINAADTIKQEGFMVEFLNFA